MLCGRRCTGICTFIVALIIHGVAQFLISRRLPLIDAALAPPRGSNLHTERKGKVLTCDILLPNKQQNPIAHYNSAVFFLLLSLPRPSGSNPFLSFPLCFSRRRVPTKKLTNRPRDAQVRLFIKKFLLRSAQQSIRRRRSGLRSKNLFALPPPSPPPSLPFGRYCFTILYYTAWYRRISPVWI